jgi:hypothetical protein
VPGQSRRSSTFTDFPGGTVTLLLDSPGRSPRRKTSWKGFDFAVRAGVTEAYRSVVGHSPPCHSWGNVRLMSLAEPLVIVTGRRSPPASRLTFVPGSTHRHGGGLLRALVAREPLRLRVAPVLWRWRCRDGDWKPEENEAGEKQSPRKRIARTWVHGRGESKSQHFWTCLSGLFR